MLKLMKYELRKQLFSKIVILAVTVLLELFFIYAVLVKDNDKIEMSVAFLMMFTTVALTIIAFESVITMSKDLKTKQSYMLFMIPRSTYQIMGAKSIMAFASTFVSGILFGVLAIADISFLTIHMEGIKSLMNLFHDILGIEIDVKYAVVVIAEMIVAWFLMIMFSFFIVILSNIVLANIKGRKIISGVAAVVLFMLGDKIINGLSSVIGGTEFIKHLTIVIIIQLILSIIMYFASAWLLDKKVSVG